MIFSLQFLDLDNPYLWLFLTGLFWGLAAGRLPFLYPRRHALRALGAPGWLFLGVCVSLGLLAALGVFFAPRGGLFGAGPVSFEAFSGAGAAAALAALGAGVLIRRFPLRAGLPLAAAVLAAAFLFWRGLSSWTPYEPGEPVLEQKILLERQDQSREPGETHGGWTSVAHLNFSDGREFLLTLDGRGLVPEMELLGFPRGWFFAGKGLFYRVPGLFSLSGGPAGTDGTADPTDSTDTADNAGEEPAVWETEPRGSFYPLPGGGTGDRTFFYNLLPGLPHSLTGYRRAVSWEVVPGQGDTVRYVLDGRGDILQERVYF